MNLMLLFFGVLLGWSVSLFLPLVLTGNVNPFHSPIGYVLISPLILLLAVFGETQVDFPVMTHARLNWIAHNANLARAKLLLVGILHGAIWLVPSAVLISIVFWYTIDAPKATYVVMLVFAAMLHIVLFGLSFFTAIDHAQRWGRTIFQRKNAVARIADPGVDNH